MGDEPTTALDHARETVERMVREGNLLVAGDMLQALMGGRCLATLEPSDLSTLRALVRYEAGLRFLPEAFWRRLHDAVLADDAARRLRRAP